MAGTTTYLGISYPTDTDYVKDGAVAIQTVADGFDSAVAIPTYQAQTGTTYTFALTDIGKTVTASNAAASIYTIPPTASVAWVANTTLDVINLGAGVVTFAAGAGVTVSNTAATLAQYASAKLVRTALNAWTVTPTSGGASGLTLISATTIGTTVSSVTISGAFSATYDNYRILVGGGAASASTDISLALGASATGYYLGRTAIVYSNTTSSNSSANNASAWSGIGRGAASGLNMGFDLLSPFLAKTTVIQGHTTNQDVNGAAGASAGWHNSSVSYTAFTIATGGTTLTGGTIRVYGYQNS